MSTAPIPQGNLSPLEALLRGLLGANGRGETEARVTEGVCALLGARWSAIFEEDASGWLCRASSGEGPRPGDRRRSPAHEEGASMAAHLTLGERAALLLVGPRDDGEMHDPRGRQTLAQIVPDLIVALDKADEIERLWGQAFVDALTGCYNRRAFDEHLHVELLRGQRYHRPTALMVADLDGFKRINDELGHQAGDHVLRRFAALLTSTFRNTDVVARFGGDEFAVIFPETTSGDALHLAHRAQLLLADTFPDELIPHPVSASFGIASVPGDATAAEGLLAVADRALYTAKSSGRNRVVAA